MAKWLFTVITLVAVLIVGVLLGSSVAEWRAAERERVVQSASTPQAPPGRRVRVEVLNAGGRNNAAREATDVLRAVGFDVVYFGNADRFDRDSSTVIHRMGDTATARLIADALGIHAVRSEPDSSLYLDASVRLGREWSPPTFREAVAPAPPWWNLPALLEKLRARE
ncbi:MAG: LytR C-terminal domain-containing protein [Gemmatimonadetes bacterium]|nr:LytR C-terminal domain-containing protein [Gemmatimonadota bacterium]